MRRILVFLITILAVSSAYAYDGILRIELATCSPDGIYNSWKERLNPKEFWINQTIVLEMELEKLRYKSVAESCSEIREQTEKIACVSYFQNLRASAARCYQTALRMCRANGACRN